MSGPGRPGGSGGPPAGGPPVAGRPPMGGGPGRGGMMGMGMGLPAPKPQDFRGSLRRLALHLRPDAGLIVLVVLLAIVSVTFAVIGPKILGNAINIIFEGAISKGLPAGTSGSFGS